MLYWSQRGWGSAAHAGRLTVNGGDILWLSLRWLHAVAAAAWVGSALFYAAVIGPSMKQRRNGESGERGADGDGERAAAAEWREFLEIGAFVLLVSGALLAANRLTQPNIGVAYLVLLGVKVGLAALMAWMAFRATRNVTKGTMPYGGLVRISWLTAGVGVAVMLLAIVLRMLYEKTLTA